MIHSELKKMILFGAVILFMVSACAEIPDGVVNPGWNDNTVINLAAPNSFVRSESDSTMAVSIEFKTTANIKSVFVKLKSQNADVFDIPSVLSQNNNTFSGEIIFPYSLPSDIYSLEIFLEELDESTKHMATSLLNYDNGQTKYEPVISNLVLVSSISRGVGFIFSVDVSDQNGLSDIQQVIFKLYRPDGSVVITNAGLDYFNMVDDGDTALYGDELENDGTYSYRSIFGSSSATGTWRFEFKAIDKFGLISNVITQNIEVN
ncbi:MAG: hypothetical protein KKA84_08600 [Bacteroidetes bacterium]|nr:hypothetical protein [Bacteroidota bacterium]